MRRLSLLPLLLLLLGPGCNQTPTQPSGQGAPESAPAAQAEAVAPAAAVPAAAPANPGQPPVEPPSLSDAESQLLRVAARPVPAGEAPDLTMACTSTLVERDRIIRERNQPGMRLAQADREAVAKWWEPVGQSLKKIDAQEIDHILFTERADLVRCVEKELASSGSNRSQGADPICLAYVTQDPQKCDRKLTSYSACVAMAQARKWGAKILAWDPKAPDYSICDTSPVSNLFFDQSMCKVAVEESCEAMTQALRVKVCQVWQNHKAPYPCEGAAKESFWCRFEKVVNSKDAQTVKKECQALLAEGNYAIPDQWCDLLIQPAAGDCLSGLASEFDVPEMALQGCGIIELAVGKERNCASELTPEQRIFCVGRFYGEYLRNPTKVSCDVLPKEFQDVCQAILNNSPDRCSPSIEASAEDQRAAELKCMRLHTEIKSMPPASQGEKPILYMEYIAPRMNVGECVLTVSAPSPDGSVWKFPVELKVDESATRLRYDLPKAITDPKGVTIEQKCTWVRQEESELYKKKIMMPTAPEVPPAGK